MIDMKVGGRAALSAIIVVLIATGCSYTATTDISPATNIYSNYPDRIAGRWALHVDADEMAGQFKVSGFVCSAHTYPVDARNAFSVSVERTLQNIMEDVEVVSNPIHREEIMASGFNGMIRVEARELEIDLTVIPGFWSSEMEADAELTVSVTVDGADGRLMGTTIEGDDDYKAQAGGACEGGATAIGKAVEAAMKETLERLGERLSNSPRLR